VGGTDFAGYLAAGTYQGGVGALGSNTTADNNTAVGYQAGYSNTTGTRNVFIGVSAGQANVTGVDSVAIGFQAMQNYTGADGSNIAIGSYAHSTATSGTAYYNVAIGYEAMKLNTAGYNNVAMGWRALTANTTGRYSVAIGYAALQSLTTGNDGSTAVGSLAGSSITTGIYNVIVGGSALSAVTTGGYNTAMGYNALGGAATTSNNNTAIGYNAMSSGGVKSNNTAVGYNSLVANSTGAQNTAVGANAGASLTVAGGDNNTAVGYNALTSANGAACEVNTAIGSLALTSVTTGTGNTGCGYNSGANLTTGVRSTYLGRSSTANNANAFEEIVISAGACTGQGDNYVTIGKNGAKIYNKYDTNATWTYTSDGRLKQNITADSLGLSFINRLRTVTYQWKPSNEVPTDMPQYGEVNTRNTTTVMHGLIAQEVKAALDAEGVTTFAGWDQGPDGVQAVSREMFITPLIKAVQELTAQVETLKAEVAALKGN
jgi:hypothetical protein